MITIFKTLACNTVVTILFMLIYVLSFAGKDNNKIKGKFTLWSQSQKVVYKDSSFVLSDLVQFDTTDIYGYVFFKVNKDYDKTIFKLRDGEINNINAGYSIYLKCVFLLDPIKPSKLFFRPKDAEGQVVFKFISENEMVYQRLLPCSGCGRLMDESFQISTKLYSINLDSLKQSLFPLIVNYLKEKYNTKGVKIVNLNPFEFKLYPVKGIVTGGNSYWENIEVALANISIENRKLRIQCFLDGEYLKVASPYPPSEESFKRPFLLDKDYPSELDAFGIDLILFIKGKIIVK